MSEPITIARPYARAAFEIARGKDQIQQWSEFLTVLEKVVAQPEVAQVIGNPCISSDEVSEILCGGFGADLTLQQSNFIRLLAAARRVPFVSRIVKLFSDYQTDAEQITRVDITSAQPLTEAQVASFQQALQKRLERRIDVQHHTDETLLGGAIIRAGDQVIDGSFKAQLEKLSAELTH